MSMTRRSFSALAVSLLGAFLLVTAASAHIIWEPRYYDVPVSNPSFTFYVQPYNTKPYSRVFPITITKPAGITVSGPASITLPANQSTASAVYSFTGAHAGDEVFFEYSDTDNTWGGDVTFY